MTNKKVQQNTDSLQIKTNKQIKQITQHKKITEWFLPVRAALADLLVGEGASQDLAEHGRVAQGLERLVQAVHQRVEELQRVVLLTQVHWLPP